MIPIHTCYNIGQWGSPLPAVSPKGLLMPETTPRGPGLSRAVGRTKGVRCRSAGAVNSRPPAISERPVPGIADRRRRRRWRRSVGRSVRGAPCRGRAAADQLFTGAVVRRAYRTCDGVGLCRWELCRWAVSLEWVSERAASPPPVHGSRYVRAGSELYVLCCPVVLGSPVFVLFIFYDWYLLVMPTHAYLPTAHDLRTWLVMASL